MMSLFFKALNVFIQNIGVRGIGCSELRKGGLIVE